MNVDYNTETQEITVELNTPKIELDTPTGGRGLKGDPGTPGINGVDGQDGVSPIITTSKSGKTTTITIEDAEGTKTATILDGDDADCTWGNITGTLSNQTDLASVLNGKLECSHFSSNIRIMDLDEGIYVSDGTLRVYYYGSSDTTNIIRVNEGSIVIVSNYSTTRNDFIITDGTHAYIGYSTSSAGSYCNILFSNDIEDSLTSTSTSKVLSAKQGKVLKGLIDAIQVPTKVSDLTNDSGFITNTVNNLTNYYTSSNTYTKTEVDNLIGAVSSLNIEVVETLPSTGISTSTIYLVPNTTHGTNNYYDEYIYVSNSWELIGSTQVDLSNYYTKTEADTLLGNKQDTLVSGTNIKTINNSSILGSGNLSISGGTPTDVQVNGTSITSDNVANLITNTAYNSSSNKIATMSDLPTIPTDVSSFNNDAGYIDNSVNNLTNYSLTTDIQNNKNLAKGIEYIVGTQVEDTNAWTGVSTDTGCSSGSLYTGKTIIYHLPYAGTSTAATLNLTLPDNTTTGAKNIYRLNNTTVTTNFVAGCDILMVYNGTSWKVNAYVDTDTNTDKIGYQLRTNSSVFKNGASTKIYRYQLLVETENGLEAFTSTSNKTDTTKTQLSPKYRPGGNIRYYGSTTAVASGADISATVLWQQYAFDARFSFNIGDSALTSGSPVYIKMSINNDGTLSPVYSANSAGHPLVQTLPSTADGYAYVLLGQAYSGYQIELQATHPIYEYKSGRIREYVDAQDKLVSGTNIKTINGATLLGSGDITIGGGGTATDVKINGTSITSGGEADIQTYGTYNSSTNKIATMSDVPSVGNSKSYYGTCSTSASTQAKVVDCTGFVLETGATIDIKFTNKQSYNGTPTLNINGTGAIEITGGLKGMWNNGDVMRFTYDGSTYRVVSNPYGGTATYGAVMLSTAIDSTATNLAATPSAVRQAYNLANGKQDALTFDSSPTSGSTNPVTSGGIYSDLYNNYVGYNSWDTSKNVYKVSNQSSIASLLTVDSNDKVKLYNLPTSNSISNDNTTIPLTGAVYSALSDKVDSSSLATVATTGAYSDLSGKPTIPTNTSDLNNDSGFITTNNDIQVNGTSIVSSNVANLITNTAYDSSSNKLATMSDLPSVPVTDIKVDNNSILSGGVANLKTFSETYNGSTNKIITETTLKNETGVGLSSANAWSSIGTFKKGQVVWSEGMGTIKMFRNITGTNTTTNPETDTTNWEQVTFMDLVADDTGWVDITLNSGISTGSIGGSTAQKPQYRKIGNHVFIRGAFAFTKGSSGIDFATLPSSVRPQKQLYVVSNIAGTRIARTYITDGGAIGCDWIYNLNGTTAYTGAVSWYTVYCDYFID